LQNKIFLSDLCEYRAFRHFISHFILGYQNFNVEELDHIHKQDVFKNPPAISEALKPKIRSVHMTCCRNLSDWVFGLNNGLFGSAAEVKEKILKALEALKSVFESFSAESEKFKQLAAESEIDLNIPLNFNDTEENQNEKKNDQRILIKLENGSLIIINDLEHLRFVCYEKSGEVNKIFMSLYTLVNSLAKNLKFCYDKKLGFVSANPAIIGTGLVMVVLIEVKNLVKEENEEKFKLFFKDNIFKYEIVNKQEGLVKIKNHVTIGISENDLLGNFVLLINDILEHYK
jgi:protein-arginine kinase